MKYDLYDLYDILYSVNPMKLSVIVPVYNVEKYIVSCLKSLLNQTFNDFEILIVNDGTKDKSIELIMPYVDDNSNRVVVLNKPNGGLSDARNYGIKFAKSEYLAFIDSDDTIHPKMFENMMNRIIAEDADICACDMEYVYDDGRRVKASGEWLNSRNPYEILCSNNSACNKIFKKTLFASIEFPKGKWYEDLATIPIIVYNAKKWSYVSEVFYYYYQREGSIAHLKNEKMFDIYWAIENINLNIKHDNSEDWLNIYHRLLIEHGLFLTGLRIKQINAYSDRKLYFKKNIEHLEMYYQNWYKDNCLKQYSLKARCIFFLLNLRHYGIVSMIYKG